MEGEMGNAKTEGDKERQHETKTHGDRHKQRETGISQSSLLLLTCQPCSLLGYIPVRSCCFSSLPLSLCGWLLCPLLLSRHVA